MVSVLFYDNAIVLEPDGPQKVNLRSVVSTYLARTLVAGEPRESVAGARGRRVIGGRGALELVSGELGAAALRTCRALSCHCLKKTKRYKKVYGRRPRGSSRNLEGNLEKLRKINDFLVVFV